MLDRFLAHIAGMAALTYVLRAIANGGQIAAQLDRDLERARSVMRVVAGETDEPVPDAFERGMRDRPR